MSYYENQQWLAGAGQASWEQQTPPARSATSSAMPAEEPGAFASQYEEVDRAMDNLIKSGKMPGPGMVGGRPFRGPGMQRPGSVSDFGGERGYSSNLQNFYATQRHQSSRGSNDAEQMMQAKRRLAANRERELRNYHQEQQYHRTNTTDASYAGSSNASNPDRGLSPSGMNEEERRDLIARQRSALYGEGPFAETGGYVDETGMPRTGVPSHQGGFRGASPLAYDYNRNQPNFSEGGAQQHPEGSRPGSNASPHSTIGNKGAFDGASGQATRTGNSSPGASQDKQGSSVAPIGTRPAGSSASSSQGPVNPALNKRATTPGLPSPLSQGYNAAGNEQSAAGDNGAATGSNASSSGVWGQQSGAWGNKSGSRAQASVWG